jgi:hypothetical protein
MLQSKSTQGRPRGQSAYTGPSSRSIFERLRGAVRRARAGASAASAMAPRYYIGA